MTHFSVFMEPSSSPFPSAPSRGAPQSFRVPPGLTGDATLVNTAHLLLARWAERLSVGAQTHIVLALGERLAAPGVAALHLRVAVAGRGKTRRLSLGRS